MERVPAPDDRPCTRFANIALPKSKVLTTSCKIILLKSKVFKRYRKMTLLASQSSLKAPSASRSPPDPSGTILDCPGLLASQSSLKAPSASRSPPDPSGSILDCPGASQSTLWRVPELQSSMTPHDFSDPPVHKMSNSVLFKTCLGLPPGATYTYKL